VRHTDQFLPLCDAQVVWQIKRISLLFCVRYNCLNLFAFGLGFKLKCIRLYSRHFKAVTPDILQFDTDSVLRLSKCLLQTDRHVGADERMPPLSLGLT
jgi:hypothetical protein